jgi:hypothetical protein
MGVIHPRLKAWCSDEMIEKEEKISGIPSAFLL